MENIARYIPIDSLLYLPDNLRSYACNYCNPIEYIKCLKNLEWVEKNLIIEKQISIPSINNGNSLSVLNDMTKRIIHRIRSIIMGKSFYLINQIYDRYLFTSTEFLVFLTKAHLDMAIENIKIQHKIIICNFIYQNPQVVRGLLKIERVTYKKKNQPMDCSSDFSFFSLDLFYITKKNPHAPYNTPPNAGNKTPFILDNLLFIPKENKINAILSDNHKNQLFREYYIHNKRTDALLVDPTEVFRESLYSYLLNIDKIDNSIGEKCYPSLGLYYIIDYNNNTIITMFSNFHHSPEKEKDDVLDDVSSSLILETIIRNNQLKTYLKNKYKLSLTFTNQKKNQSTDRWSRLWRVPLFTNDVINIGLYNDIQKPLILHFITYGGGLKTERIYLPPVISWYDIYQLCDKFVTKFTTTQDGYIFVTDLLHLFDYINIIIKWGIYIQTKNVIIEGEKKGDEIYFDDLIRRDKIKNIIMNDPNIIIKSDSSKTIHITNIWYKSLLLDLLSIA